MKKTFDTFEKECRKCFMFLEEEFDFKTPKRQRMHLSSSLTYQNNTTAVEVSLEPLDGGVFVLLSRLVNGKIPEYPIFVTRDMALHSYYLDDLVGLKRPDTPVREANEDASDVREVKKALAQSAAQLRELGSDILKGDFAVFDRLDRIVKARLPKEPT